MKLNIKSKELKKVMDNAGKISKEMGRCRNMEDAKKVFMRHTREEMGFSAVYGYLHSLVENAEDSGLSLDLTYGTLRNLPEALNELFMAQGETYDYDTNKDIIGKTIGSYMTLLCANEAGGDVRIEYLRDDNMDEETYRRITDSTWSGCRISVGPSTKSDFRQAGLDCISDGEDGLDIDFSPVIELYKKTAGTDLGNYGLNNYTIECPPEYMNGTDDGEGDSDLEEHIEEQLDYMKRSSSGIKLSMLTQELKAGFDFCDQIAADNNIENPAVPFFKTATAYILAGGVKTDKRMDFIKACFENVKQMSNTDIAMMTEEPDDEDMQEFFGLFDNFSEIGRFMDIFLNYLLAVATEDDDAEIPVERVKKLFLGEEEEYEDNPELEEEFYNLTVAVMEKQLACLENNVLTDQFLRSVAGEIEPMLDEKADDEKGFISSIVPDVFEKAMNELVSQGKMYKSTVQHVGGMTEELVWNKPFQVVDPFTDPLFHSNDAEEWLEEAENGDEEAMYQLGNAYSDGMFGLEKDAEKSLEWYEKAGEAGHADGAYNAGIAWQMGQYGADKQDYEKAFYWFSKAAELGNETAVYKLAYFYQEGFGVPCSYVKAYEWYKKAADLGSGQAAEVLYHWKPFINANVGKNPKLVFSADKAFGYAWTCRLNDRVEDCRMWLERAASLGSAQAKLALRDWKV